MKVYLPGSYTGEQIFEAFKAAAPYQDENTRWDLMESSHTTAYRPGSVKPILAKNAWLIESRRTKLFWFFGPKVWETHHPDCHHYCPDINLQELQMDQVYAEVKIEIPNTHCAYDCNNAHKTHLERVIAGMYERLQKLPQPA